MKVESKNCVLCGKQFDVNDSIFCSLECALEYTEQKFQKDSF